jgi:prolyl 4-hydroxylase
LTAREGESATSVAAGREEDETMLSYIVAFVAFLLFFSNPIFDALWSSRRPRANEPLPDHVLRNDSLLALPDESFDASECPPHGYTVRIFSRDPLVLYIENFLSEEERHHLMEIR